VGTSGLDALKAALVSNNRYADWCTIAVFVGLLIEYTILLWLKRKDLSRLDITLTILAGLAIAGGVYGEHHFGSAAASAAIQIESISEQRIADAQLAAGGANAMAQAATLQAAALNTEAGEARKAAGEAAERAAKLEQQLEWRRLSPQQVDTICKALLPLSGAKLEIETLSANAEGFRYAEDFAEALRSKECGWIVTGPTSILTIGNSPPDEGVLIEVSDGHNPTAVALQLALKSVNISAPGRISSSEPNTVTLFVGVKPRPMTRANKTPKPQSQPQR